jgi:predicted HAD superfamily phosphohydrolase YqeG
MQTIQFKKPVKTKTTRTVFVDLDDFLNEVENDEITPEIAVKIKKYREMSDEKFINSCL